MRDASAVQTGSFVRHVHVRQAPNGDFRRDLQLTHAVQDIFILAVGLLLVRLPIDLITNQ
jgi:hypothetical protein